jgi:glycine cleavage system H lipoate-binding protein
MVNGIIITTNYKTTKTSSTINNQCSINGWIICCYKLIDILKYISQRHEIIDLPSKLELFLIKFKLLH